MPILLFLIIFSHFAFQVVEKCRRGRYQPLLLLFATPNGSPIDGSSAPKSVTLVDRPAMNLHNGHSIISKPPIRRCSTLPTSSDSCGNNNNNNLAVGGRRSLTPSPEKPRINSDLNQRRAVTPNPEQLTVTQLDQVSFFSPLLIRSINNSRQFL